MVPTERYPEPRKPTVETDSYPSTLLCALCGGETVILKGPEGRYWTVCLTDAVTRCTSEVEDETNLYCKQERILGRADSATRPDLW
jgi:hypothetical protein